ncbi:MAG: TolC family protein [Ginsengibacter sp.]
MISRQDTLVINLKQAEDSFLTKNLSLLAQHYSIDSAKATVITARLYDNPQFSYATSFFQPESKKFFDLTDKNRETAIQISQLIKTAGKRNKAIGLALSGIDITQNQFYDLLRNLRYTLRNDFYNIYYLEKSEKLYEVEINSLKSIVPAYEQEEKKGFVSLKDVLRIKAQLYTLQAEYNDLQTNIDNIQSELRLLIRVNSLTYIVPQVDSLSNSSARIESLSFQSLVDTALANRPDIRALQATIGFNRNNLILQKALAKPDINLNLNYDRQGSYVKYFNAIGFAIPIPIFNRNQGNIKNAQIQINAAQVQFDAGVERVRSELTSSYITALRAEKLLASFDPEFDRQLEKLTSEVFKNFKKRNITILEFLDSYESYKQNVLQLNKLRFNKMNALEQLNFSTGSIIFNK